MGAKAPPVMIAGLAGRTAQAVGEAQIARDLGYHAGLLSLAAMKGASEDELIAHAETVAREMPLVGFYLQPAVGGIVLPVSFWRRFAAIENVVAIKIAPFNRYRTLDVVRGVVEAGAADRITLYTGNDDHIVLDLVTPFTVMANGEPTTVRIKGGLLGHWSVWVKTAVELLDRIHARSPAAASRPTCSRSTPQVTDCNAAIFDVANDFHGVICGCHEILRRQGLLEGIWCLDPNESLGPGQKRGDRPGLRRLSASRRRRLRARECRALAGVTHAAMRYRPDLRGTRLGRQPRSTAALLARGGQPSAAGRGVVFLRRARQGAEASSCRRRRRRSTRCSFRTIAGWRTSPSPPPRFSAAISSRSSSASASRCCSPGSAGSRWLSMPLLVSLNMIPKVALGPLIIVWFKYGIGPNIMMAFAICFFPIVLTTARGLSEVEPDLLDLVRTLKGSRWQVFTKIQLPGALPYIFSGMKVAAILAVAGAIVGEFLGSDRGLGYLMLQVQVTLDTAAMFMAVILITLIGGVLY